MAKKMEAKKAKEEAPVKEPAASPAKDDSSEGVGCAALSYLLVGIIWYFADDNMRKNNFAKFHVKQALVLLIAWVIVSVALSILGVILGFLPIIGWVTVWILWFVFGVGFFILWIMGIIAAATSKQKILPVIGDFADKLKF
jgi:uncharacterized membrane protein